MINDNTYHLDSYSRLVYIVRYNAHIETNSSLQEPMRQEQRTEKDKRHSLNKLNIFNSLSNKNKSSNYPNNITSRLCYIRIKS